MTRFVFAIALCGCTEATPVVPPVVPVETPDPPTPVPVVPVVPVKPRDVAALHDIWADAVATQNPARIAALLVPPFTAYYDDGMTGPRLECKRWDRATVKVTTIAERDAFASCIVATVVHSSNRLGDRSDPTHPFGVVPLDTLQHLVDEPVRDALVPLATDHVFVHGKPSFASDFDFTLALPRDGTRIVYVGLASHPGC